MTVGRMVKKTYSSGIIGYRGGDLEPCGVPAYSTLSAVNIWEADFEVMRSAEASLLRIMKPLTDVQLA